LGYPLGYVTVAFGGYVGSLRLRWLLLGRFAVILRLRLFTVYGWLLDTVGCYLHLRLLVTVGWLLLLQFTLLARLLVYLRLLLAIWLRWLVVVAALVGYVAVERLRLVGCGWLVVALLVTFGLVTVGYGWVGYLVGWIRLPVTFTLQRLLRYTRCGWLPRLRGYGCGCWITHTLGYVTVTVAKKKKAHALQALLRLDCGWLVTVAVVTVVWLVTLLRLISARCAHRNALLFSPRTLLLLRRRCCCALAFSRA